MGKSSRVIAILSSLVIRPALHQAPANAKPFLYMSSYDYSGSYLTCIDNAEKVLRSHGFSRELKSEKDADSRSAMVYAWHVDESATADIRCYQKEGVTLLGVAGLDNETTYDFYQKLKGTSKNPR
jgi:hypothetical protein